jgi:hypothetical protein
MDSADKPLEELAHEFVLVWRARASLSKKSGVSQ